MQHTMTNNTTNNDVPKTNYNSNNFRITQNDATVIFDEVAEQLRLVNFLRNQKELAKYQGNAKKLLDEYVDRVTSYVAFSEELCIPTKTTKKFGNDKPWFSRAIKNKISEKNALYKSGDRAEFNKAKRAVESAVTEAKREYCHKLEGYLQSSDPRRVWQGLQEITNMKKKQQVADNDNSLLDKLNIFYSRFDTANMLPQAPSGRKFYCTVWTGPDYLQMVDLNIIYKQGYPV